MRFPLLVILASLLASYSTCLSAQEAGFESLFNGKDLSGWKGDKRYWSVVDGAITGRTTPDNLLKYNTFLIWEGGSPADFELRLQYRIVGGNSGVQYRSRVVDESRYVVNGYQADIDSAANYTGMNYEEGGRAFLAQRGQRVTIAADGAKQAEAIGDKNELQKKVKNEDWNDYVIIAQGNRMRHFVNGVLMSEVIDNQPDKSAASGVIAFQAHQGPPMTVQFKEIRIKAIK